MRTLIVSLAFVAICMCGCNIPEATEENPCTVKLYSGGQLIREWQARSWTPGYKKEGIDFTTTDGKKFHVSGTIVVEEGGV